MASNDTVSAISRVIGCFESDKEFDRHLHITDGSVNSGVPFKTLHRQSVHVVPQSPSLVFPQFPSGFRLNEKRDGGDDLNAVVLDEISILYSNSFPTSDACSNESSRNYEVANSLIVDSNGDSVAGDAGSAATAEMLVVRLLQEFGSQDI